MSCVWASSEKNSSSQAWSADSQKVEHTGASAAGAVPTCGWQTAHCSLAHADSQAALAGVSEDVRKKTLVCASRPLSREQQVLSRYLRSQEGVSRPA
jgi:hypothetical protein